eukprot:jgi/Mesvir1/16195/Mv08457-RA.1
MTVRTRGGARGDATPGEKKPEVAAEPTGDTSVSALPSAPAISLGTLAFFCLAPAAFFSTKVLPSDRGHVFYSLVFSLVAFLLTVRIIPSAKGYMLKRNLCGMDINKRGTPEGKAAIPEAMGLASGIVYLVAIIVFQHLVYTQDSEWLLEFNAALASICFMLFLGFVDDVLDLPWRIKLLLPSVAALPLLMAYSGGTSVLLPKPLRGLLGVEVLALGVLYKVYMGMLAVFCSNSINILAGINGLEAGQTLVIASSVVTFNLQQLAEAGENQTMREAHLFSLGLMLPLVATTMGLLKYNWYPSRVFVGDTFTYFAGMTLAVAGILGHFSETLLLFFLPQILNFVYSLPQLFKLVPCPRHRLPKLHVDTGLLEGSNDFNLVNLTLRVLGPCTEAQLAVRLLAFQAICCAGTFLARFLLKGIYK